MERDMKEAGHIPEGQETKITGEKLIAYYKKIEGTPDGVPSNEPVPVFPHKEIQDEGNHAE